MVSRKVWIPVAVVAALAVAGAAAGYAWLRSTGRPRRSGAVSLAGLGAPVTVRFDRWGVPAITAASGRDAVAALGWLHANDRMTQMELGRRAASGRLSEVVGAAALELDRQALTLRLRRAAEGLWQSAGSESREWLAAYASGVNAWLGSRGGDLPPALKLLGIEPEPWQPVDSLCFALLMARDLSFWDGRPEEERFRWLGAFGPEAVRQLLGDPDLQVPDEILAMARRMDGEVLGAAASPGADGASSAAPGGSNNWAVGADRSASGSPLVANDPHLPLRLPALWYQVLIRAPDYEVAGMTLAGLPGVVIGRSRHLAWALTNTMLDDHDLFFEQLDRAGKRVRRGDGWAAVAAETVPVKVRGGEEVSVELRATDRGPLLPADPVRGLPARSLAWTAYLPADPLAAFLGLARSATVDEARDAISGFVVPAQNLVAADDSGGLVQTVLGRVPRRRHGDGRLPSPGWDAAYGWDGLRPTAENPVVLRPADGLLVTANQDVRPPGYSLPLAADFDTPHRADRIRELLEGRPSWRLSEMAAIQTDVVSLYARQVVALAVGSYPGDAGRALAVLNGWDGTMARRGPAALFALAERELRRGIFADEAAAHDLPPLDSRARLVAALAGDLDPAWLDDVSTPEVEDRSATIGAALARAWREGEERWGPDVAAWGYEELHPLLLAHPAGRLPVLGRFFDRGPFPMPGSSTTVAAFGCSWRGELCPVSYGPSMRWLTELTAPDDTLAVLPGGQSGHPFDPHYDDQLPLYLEGRLHPVAWSEEAVAAATVSTLTLSSAPEPAQAAQTGQAHPSVYSAYVLLGQSPRDGAARAEARAIVAGDATGCPELLGGSRPLPMSFRLNPHGFAVKVCEAPIPFDRPLTLSWTGQALPVARRNPRRLVVIGDTGCKEKDCPGTSEAKPFAALAAAAAALSPPPEVVLHAGDYNYRGTGFFEEQKQPVYDAGDVAEDDSRCQLDGAYVSQNAGYSDRPDRWEDWWLDFFQPAAPLLAAAPWIVARGNHELCSRGGPGWFYFLDPSAEPAAGGSGQLACPPQGGDAPATDGAFSHLVLEPPYTVDLGTLRVAVLDSANACDGFAPEETTAAYAAQLAAVLGQVPAPGAPTWLLSHRPVWGIAGKTSEGGWITLNATLQQALGRAFPGPLPAGLRLSVAGHQHQFLALTFPPAAGRPPQLVIGNSGVQLETGDPAGTFTATVAGRRVEALSFSHHGFLAVDGPAADGGWRGRIVDPDSGAVLATCDSARLPGPLCAQAAAPAP